MINYPLVSILIPLYNAEKYISETIESALVQTYANIEILIYDDGSIDNSLKIALQYANKYENIKVFTHENCGAQITRNKLFELSSGAYIQYLDADDLLHKNKIKEQMDLLKDYDHRTVVFGQWSTFYNSDLSGVRFKRLSVYRNYNDPICFLIDLWANLEAVSPHAWLVPRVLIEESDKWNLALIKNQDGEFFARIVAKSNKIVFSENSKVYYRLDSQNSVSKNFSDKAVESVLLSIDSYANVLDEYMDRPNSKFALAKIYSNFMFSIYPEHLKLIQTIEARLKFLGYEEPLPIKDFKVIKLSYKIFGAYNMMKILKFIKNYKSSLITIRTRSLT